MSDARPAPGTTEHSRLVRDLVERHAGERGRGRTWAVCQLCGRLDGARGMVGHIARSHGPAGTHCHRHGHGQELLVASLELPDRYCEICAAVRDPHAPGRAKLCDACAPVWPDAPNQTLSELLWLRGVAHDPQRRRALSPLLRLVRHPHPRFVPLTADRARRITREHRAAERAYRLGRLREQAVPGAEARVRIAALEELLRDDPLGERVAPGEPADPLGLLPFVRPDA